MPHKTPYRVADRVLFGAAYYPEYIDHDRVDEDLRLMREAGFSLIRVGESVWTTWEPREGAFQLEWLLPTLDAAHENGIAVLLGTPTYAVPPWLMVKHPEIAAETSTGVRQAWGARQETDSSHPVFREYAERIIRAVIGRYADHPAVVGFQVDNEPGHQLPHNEHVFARFKAWLLERFGSVDVINDRWNLAHWAHRMTDIDELWRPDGNHVPQYDLAWRRFQAELTTDYIDWQVRIVREYAADDQFITTCIDPMRSSVHDFELGGVLDVAASNQYLATQSELDPTVVGDYAFPPSGSWAPFFAADRSRSIRQENFLVTETDASSIGFPWFNFPSYDGQWRQVGWAMIARGARGVSYWHWHSMHASWESYWGGILPHSFMPGRVYENIAGLGREIQAAGAAVEGLVPDAGVGLVFSMPTRWAMEFHPPLQADGMPSGKQGAPDRAAYERILYRIYGGLSRAGHQVAVWHAEHLLAQDPVEFASTLPVLVAPGLVLVGNELSAWFREYARAGGHLVLGIRTATSDDDGRVRSDVQPAGLAESAGVHYSEFSNLLEPVSVTGWRGNAERLIEGLETDSADVLARYDHPHFGRWAAVTTQAVGTGRITYLGAFPDLELATALGEYLAPASPWAAVLEPGAITAHGATNAVGDRIWFVHNWSDTARTIEAPFATEDVLVAGAHGAATALTTIELGPRDVRVLREVAQ